VMRDIKKIWDWWDGKDEFTPLSLGPSLWIDAINGAYVSTVDNNGTRAKGNIINSATAETGQALTNAGTLASKGIYNGEGWYMKLGAEFNTGSVSDYNFLHNGSDFEVWFTYKKLLQVAGNIRALINTNGFSNTAIGFLLYDDNTGGLNTLKLRIGNGTSAVISRDMNGATTQNATNVIRVTKSGNVVTIFVNGIQVGTQTATLSFNAGNASQIMDIASTTAAGIGIYLKDIVMFNRVLTVEEVALMNARTFISIIASPINVDVIYGDSNAEGQAVNSGLPAELSGTHNTLIFKMATAAVQVSDYIEKLQLGINHKILNQTLTISGGEMRLGYSFANPSLSRAILKFGQGSTDATAWTTPSQTYTRWIAIIPEFIDDMLHVHRRTVVLRSMVSWFGANDCQIGDGANYESAVIALVKATIDTFNAASTNFGTVVKMRHVIFKTKSGGSGFDATAYNLVSTAQDNLGAGSFLTAHPSYSTYYLGSVAYSTELATMLPDTIHYADYDGMSTQAYNYLQPFENE
jgi:hypothetical protein